MVEKLTDCVLLGRPTVSLIVALVISSRDSLYGEQCYVASSL